MLPLSSQSIIILYIAHLSLGAYRHSLPLIIDSEQDGPPNQRASIPGTIRSNLTLSGIGRCIYIATFPPKNIPIISKNVLA